MSAFPQLQQGQLEEIHRLCLRCLPDPPSVGELRDSLFSADQPALVRGHLEVGVVATVVNGTSGFVRLLGVDPSVRRRGHGRCLLEAAENDLRRQGATTVQIGADAPYYLYPGVPTGETAMLCLLERCRYQRHEANFNMTVDLGSLPDEAGPSGDDERSVETANVEGRDEVASWMRHHWPNWEAEALRALNRSTLLVGRDEAGISAICAYGVNRRDLLGPVAVRGDLMGRGVGAPLIVAALRRMRASGLSHADVSWVGPIFPYARLGARLGEVFFVYRKNLR